MLVVMGQKVISICEGHMMCGFIICVKLVAMTFLHLFRYWSTGLNTMRQIVGLKESP